MEPVISSLVTIFIGNNVLAKFDNQSTAQDNELNNVGLRLNVVWSATMEVWLIINKHCRIAYGLNNS